MMWVDRRGERTRQSNINVVAGLSESNGRRGERGRSPSWVVGGTLAAAVMGRVGRLQEKAEPGFGGSLVVGGSRMGLRGGST